MKKFILKQTGYWEALIDAETGEILVEGRHLSARDVLIALRDNSVLNFEYEIEL